MRFIFRHKLDQKYMYYCLARSKLQFKLPLFRFRVQCAKYGVKKAAKEICPLPQIIKEVQ